MLFINLYLSCAKMLDKIALYRFVKKLFYIGLKVRIWSGFYMKKIALDAILRIVNWQFAFEVII